MDILRLGVTAKSYHNTRINVKEVREGQAGECLKKDGTKNISITDLSLCLLSMTPTCTPSWTRMRTMSYSSSPSIDVLFISFIILIRYLTAIVKLRMKVMRICLNLFEMHISPEKSKLVFALYS